ncbi:MAG: fimbrial protein [Desulfuromonas sp.]|nr:MAG: fimbrial protein [Desulfuromonas sp.]
MIRINLLPVRAAQRKEKIRTQVSVLCLGIVLVCVGCGAEYIRMGSKIDDKAAEISVIEQENNQLKKKIGEVSRYKKLQADLKKKLDILNVLKEGKSGPVHLLNELSLALPDKLWIVDFSVSGTTASLKGLCFSEKIVASFMRNLEKSPYYRNVELGVTEQANVSGVKLQRFALTCQTEKPAEKR